MQVKNPESPRNWTLAAMLNLDEKENSSLPLEQYVTWEKLSTVYKDNAVSFILHDDLGLPYAHSTINPISTVV